MAPVALSRYNDGVGALIADRVSAVAKEAAVVYHGLCAVSAEHRGLVLHEKAAGQRGVGIHGLKPDFSGVVDEAGIEEHICIHREIDRGAAVSSLAAEGYDATGQKRGRG